MNRAQKRQQAKPAPKPNRSKMLYTNHAFQAEFEAFDSIERLFEHLDHGSLSYDADGFCIMGLSGEMLHIESALSGWCDYWKTAAQDNGIAYNDSALITLKEALAADRLLTRAEVNAAYEVVTMQRKMFKAIPCHIRLNTVKKVQQNIRRDTEIAEYLTNQSL